ncbi:hypothetical protein BGZ65_006265 [Modicella reniformis]|uniref:Uncharacterized protein n=1 Tax=Modicella reniformis TaxID=1440133 RepID=A0A9P6IX12_9FUNG|nr:hypothetical protein BGZ65_006265 [Modicella reniformis]
MWVLAAIGGIVHPPNGMSNASCKVLPSGKETSDVYYLRACRAMKNRNKQVGGQYKLSMTPSQYRRAEKENEEGKTLKGAGEHEEELEPESSSQGGTSAIVEGNFSDQVYHDPIIPAPPMIASTPLSLPANHNPYLASELHIQQQQQQQHQYQLQQQQNAWTQQPAYVPY